MQPTLRAITPVFVLLALTLSSCRSPSTTISNPMEPLRDPPKILVGPIGGFNQNFHTGGFTSLAPEAVCPNFTTGEAVGFFNGLSAEMILDSLKDSHNSLVMRVMYDSRPSSFAESGDEFPTSVVANGRRRIVLSSTQHSAEISYSMLAADLVYKLMIGDSRIAIAAGPSFGYVIDASLHQRFDLIEPLNAQFDPNANSRFPLENNGRSLVIFRGDIPDINRWRVGLKMGLMYEVNLHNFIAVPAIWYDIGLTKLTKTENWRVNALQLGVDVRFAM